MEEFSRRIVAGQAVATDQWQHPDEGGLSAERRRGYRERKLAVTLFLNGARPDTIFEQSNFTAKYAYRLIGERCLAIHEDGLPYGWRGLVPYVHIKPYKRKTKIGVDKFGHGGAGALEATLDRYPKLRNDLDKRILKYPRGTTLESKGYTPREICRWFLNELRALGHEATGEWPFGTESQAYYSIRRYSIKLREKDVHALAALTGGPEQVRKLKTGDGAKRPVHHFMQRVEMDAHKLDGIFCVSIPRDDGTTHEKIVHRLWVIVILEIMSRVVLGFYFSMRKEVSNDDVLRCIKRALTKTSLKKVTFSDEPYRSGAGFPSTMDSNYIGLCWDETSVDGALAEVSKSVAVPLKEIVGSVILNPQNSFAKRRSPDDRPFIEKFFSRLAKGGFQRMTNTTGAKAADRKGRRPDTIAITSRFQYEYAEELLGVLIANYNATEHSSIGRTPLDYFRFLYGLTNDSLRVADPATVDSLCSSRKLCRVRGGAKMGRSCFVEYMYARYSNETLQNRQDLVGEKIWVLNHKEDDARVALAFTTSGQALGVLRASPPWNRLPHSVAVRKAVSQLVNNGKFDILSGACGIESFLGFVERQPNNKLPVHPAYLEVRRILSAAIEPDAADAGHETLTDEHVPQQLAEHRGRSLASSSAAVKPSSSDTANHMPARRAAITRT